MPPDSYQTSFGNHGTRDFAPGAVYGLRWWYYTNGKLYGQRASWQPGVNTAACLFDSGFPTDEWLFDGERWRGAEHRTPEPDCECGFYAYWASTAIRDVPRPFPLCLLPSAYPVCGVIEGYGRVLIGDLGFRCGKARIVGLATPDHHFWEVAKNSGYLRFRAAADRYGVPLYQGITTLLKHHPLTTDYDPNTTPERP
jgi:hypothetical protein